MPNVTVYHNVNFLEYRGKHSQIMPPTRPVATVIVPADSSLHEMLGAAYT